jgi:hypothetical protein
MYPIADPDGQSDEEPYEPNDNQRWFGSGAQMEDQDKNRVDSNRLAGYSECVDISAILCTHKSPEEMISLCSEPERTDTNTTHVRATPTGPICFNIPTTRSQQE